MLGVNTIRASQYAGVSDSLQHEGDVAVWNFGDNAVDIRDSGTPANNLLRTPVDDAGFTYTSPSAKMVWHSDGELKHKAHNLCIRSQEFDNAAWTKTRTTITADSVANPVDGATDADTLREDGTASSTHIVLSTAISFVSGHQYKVTLYAKKANRDWIVIDFTTAAFPASAYSYYDLATPGTGTLGSGSDSASITDLGDGWCRCELVATADANNSSSITIYVAEADGDLTLDGLTQDSAYIYGAQVSAVPADDTYIPTTTAAVYSLPRDHDPAASNAALGLLVEESRTNLCLESEDFTATWTNTNTDEPTTNNSDPSGLTNGVEVAATSTADQEFAIEHAFTGLTANVDTTCSVYLKAGTRASGDDFIQLVWEATGASSDGCFCNFNLTSGAKGSITAFAAGTATAASITSVGNSWYRCTITGKIASGTVGVFAIHFIDNISAAGKENANLTDNDSVIAWGAQVEVGAFPTSYIPAYGATVTRAIDDVSFALSAAPWNSGGAGAFVTKYRQGQDSRSNMWIISAREDGNKNATMLQSFGNMQAEYYNSASNAITITSGAPGAGNTGKAANTWDTNVHRFEVDQTAGTEDNTVTLWSGATGVFWFGGVVGSGTYIYNGHIEYVKYLDRVLTQANLDSETA